MQDISGYERNAAKCRELAQGAQNSDHRRRLEEMANEWDVLARGHHARDTATSKGTGLQHNGRLIRVSQYRSDAPAIAYIVAIADPAQAIELIRTQVADPKDEIEDLGRVTESLLAALHLGTGQFKRA